MQTEKVGDEKGKRAKSLTFYTRRNVAFNKKILADNYMFKVNNRNIRTRCEIFKVNNVGNRATANGIVLVSLLVTLNIFQILF